MLIAGIPNMTHEAARNFALFPRSGKTVLDVAASSTPAFVKHVCVPLRGRHGRPVDGLQSGQVIGGAALGNRRVATSALVRNL
jgi:hypothetical protein